MNIAPAPNHFSSPQKIHAPVAPLSQGSPTNSNQAVETDTNELSGQLRVIDLNDSVKQQLNDLPGELFPSHTGSRSAVELPAMLDRFVHCLCSDTSSSA